MKKIIPLVLAALSLSGCSLIPKEVTSLVLKLLGRSSTEVEQSPAPSPSVDASQYTSDAANRAKANGEILKEMFQVIFVRDPKDRGEFGNWVDTLNQGASIEGVYRGLTLSAEYRKLEQIGPAASVKALKIFGEELSILESEFPVPTQFDSISASPLPPPDEPRSGASPKVDAKLLADQYSRQFVGATLYSLKRILGEEALKVISAKSEYKEKLAQWYSKWAVRIIQQRNVDFGIPLRNKPDEAFHYKWAVETDADRVTWEVLNRIHRLMNIANN